MLSTLLMLSLSVGSRSRVIYCGPLIENRPPVLRILARTPPAFEPLVEAPVSFREEASGERPRSFAAVACSPSLCDDFRAPDRFFRRDFIRPSPRQLHRHHPAR